MNDERWRRIEELYHGAIEQPPHERASWLSETCGDDDELRREVQTLLRFDGDDSGFLERSALTVEAAAVARDRRAGIIGRLVGGYEVLSFLGAGGMADVYRARDVRLGREVALKVFEHAGAGVPVAGYETEARAASALNHPNIVTIYGIGEADDVTYIAMELAAGHTLRERLSRGALPVPETIGIAAQLAEAIAAAHARGIVHRDLKPENVMVSPEGRVKVLDFGIATLQHELLVSSDPAADRAHPSAAAGTARYMSPEQARGEATGPSSDQFSFGLICREMLTGQALFLRPTRRETLEAIASGDPVPALSAREVPALAEVLARCLAKDPARRYPDSNDLAAIMRRISNDIHSTDRPARPTRRQVLVLGALAALATVASVTAWRRWPRDHSRRRLAVLPFGNPNGDASMEHLCDGITETLIRQLARLPSVTVIARATAFTFKGSRDDPMTIGRRLSVDAALTGSVTRRAGRLRIAAELADCASGVRLWGTDYDVAAADVLAVQNQIADAIVREGLRLEMTDTERRRIAALPTDDPEAYELFLRAVHHFRVGTELDYLAARELLMRAVERDSQFGLALVTVASTYSAMALDGYTAPDEAWPEAARYVALALEADPDLPDAHAEAAAYAFFYRWDWQEAERQWAHASRLRTEVQSDLLAAYSFQKWASGQLQAALELARAARDVDPLSAQASVREADVLAALGRLDEAVAAYERITRDLPEDPRAYFGLAEARRRQGLFDQALSARRQAHAVAGDESFEELFERARGAAGYRDIQQATARRELDVLAMRAEGGGYVSPLDRARAFAQLGDPSRAFENLTAAIDERAPGVALLRVDPAWTDLRGDPRFAAALARVGLPSSVTW
jgi:serine/threonine protein kinase/tetratricopeptide (TPR) repeat protein